VDRYHGVEVPDPYRPLEDIDAPEVVRWLEEQKALTERFLASIPEREAVRRRLTEIWDHDSFGVPWRRGDRLFWFHNPGLLNQSRLMVAEGDGGGERVLLDPNLLSEDGTVALSGLSLTDDGAMLAYSLSEAGSDWVQWRVMDVATGDTLPDVLRWSKFSGAAWAPDNSGFWYARFDAPPPGEELGQANRNHKLFFHRLGDPQEADSLAFETPEHPDWLFDADVTEDGRYLLIYAARGAEVENALFALRLDEPGAQPRAVFADFDAEYRVVGSDGDMLYVQTNKDAPRRRIVAVNLAKPGEWSDIVPESADSLIASSLVGDTFIVTYLCDARVEVRLFALSGEPAGRIELPGIGDAVGFAGRRKDRDTFFLFQSFAVAPTIYRYDLVSQTLEVWRRVEVDFRPEDFETVPTFFQSKDGTRVPMFVTHRKGLARDGGNPVLLTGYGGFGIPVKPAFALSMLPWLEMGGVYAVANLRGGGEYGEEWHQAGMREKKQNVFDDFIAAAEHLIASGYTRPDRLAIAGGSNGGLLVGAVITQRPELFGAALPAVGVMDMLRFPKFTIGWGWQGEYGSPDDEAMFPVLRSYSPLHNLRPGTSYPATLVLTADHDDRVYPAHSFKFAAALQACQGGAAPTLLRVDSRAGHGAGKPTAKLIAEAADRLAFLTKALGITAAGN
jgi:prolyl oligopeptidase